MTDATDLSASRHSHVFLADTHAASERKTWAVIWLCGAMMLLEIAGGFLFGSIALVADGLHMSTHAGALLLAALAYTYARRHADDPVFTFGTGKLGDLAGFTSAIILAMIALLIGYEAVGRLFAPVRINFAEAIPIAGLGLAVNVVSAWLLSGGDHHHGHSHGHGHAHCHDHSHGHGHAHHSHDEDHVIDLPAGRVALEVFEDGVPPRFRLHPRGGSREGLAGATIGIVRPDGGRQLFGLVERAGFWESVDEIPEPHAFVAEVRIAERTYPVVFEEAGPPEGAARSHRDNNMRAALVHVVADAAVSVFVILGLGLARTFGWMWMDPLAGLVGAAVIASWSFALIRDTGAILLDMNPEPQLTETLRAAIETDGDRVADLHLWRLGPGHLGAIVSVLTAQARDAAFYRAKLRPYRSLSHVTIEVSGIESL